MRNTKKSKVKGLIAVSSLALTLGLAGANTVSADCTKDDQHRDWPKNNWNERNRMMPWMGFGRFENRDNKMSIFGEITDVKSDGDTIKVEIRYRDKTFTVDTTDARIVDRKGEKMDADNFDEGNRVVVFGEKDNDDSIKADWIRDFSRS